MRLDYQGLPLGVQERLPEWKQQYGEVFFVPELAGTGLLLRNFNLLEHDIYLVESQLDQDLADEHLINRCVLWPDTFDLDNLPTPAAKAILNKLNEVSPFDNAERFFQKLEQKRHEVDTPKGQMCAYVVAAFPGMPLVSIKKLHFDELMEHVALAEKILGQTFQLTPQGGIQAVPEQDLSPSQLEQLRKKKQYEARKARREQMLADQGITRAAPPSQMGVPFESSHEPPVDAPAPANAKRASDLMKDRDEIQRALWAADSE